MEVAIRLNKPTLIFAPSIAIRNQWAQRFCELFYHTDTIPEWISFDIRNPKFLTIVTYQALHSACSGGYDTTSPDEENDESSSEKATGKFLTKEAKIIAGKLTQQKIGTLIVDEAHHLKNEWWKSLTAIKDALNPRVVGLTATPPYDVSYAEWQRYIELNGPVDTEITVPELVIEGDLCPHQDFVMMSKPTEKEFEKISKYKQNLKKVYKDLTTDKFLIQALSRHKLFINPSENLQWIYNNLEFYSAILIYLNTCGIAVTPDHLKIIGNKKMIIPELNYEWLEIVLTFYLFTDKDTDPQYKEHKESLINKLSRNGILERKSINFRKISRITKLLSSSISKLNSIDEIVDIEHDTLGNDLRMVILTDYIRKEFLVNDKENNLELNKIGVVPVFEKLRRSNDRLMRIGVLSGSIVIIPESAMKAFNSYRDSLNIDSISYSKLEFDNLYINININEKLKPYIVQIITRLFEQGEIEVLISTKSLLGEGWDAPKINSLILASFVGSYVLSNQMRGRAIRTDRKNKEKTSNIWHLVCVDNSEEAGGDDLELLERRFKSFVGISFENENISIENGLKRLDLPGHFILGDNIKKSNKRMINEAARRRELKKRWELALNEGTYLVEEIMLPFPKEKKYKEIKSIYFYKTIAFFISMLFSGVVAFWQGAYELTIRSIRSFNSPQDFINFISFLGVLFIIIFGQLFFKALSMYLKYRDISKDIKQIGEALIAALIKVGVITSNPEKLKVVATMSQEGVVFCHLSGGTTFEKSIFLKSLQEVVGPVTNPRYIIIRKSTLMLIISQKDYHSVPEIISKNKKSATYFERMWRKFVGRCELIFTHTITGRQILLNSRINSLSAQFQDKSERINKWR